MIEITTDDRERNGGVIDCLCRHRDVSLVVERLPLGDYLIDEVLLIERKTLPDLTASIRDGRLFGQAHRLTGWPLWKAFILEGTATDLAESGMRREAILRCLDRCDPLSGHSPNCVPRVRPRRLSLYFSRPRAKRRRPARCLVPVAAHGARHRFRAAFSRDCRE